MTSLFVRKCASYLAATALIASVGFVPVAAAQAQATADRAQHAQTTGPRGDWLDLKTIHDHIEKGGELTVREISRKKYGYKVKATDESGHKVKLYVEPINGQVVYEKHRDRNRDHKRNRD